MDAYIITIGDELLIGQIIDSNSAWLGQQLNLIGINVAEIISISDDHDHIIETLTKVKEKSNLVILTGGLGPTRDDITKLALADFFQEELIFYPEILDHIKDLFSKFGRTIPETTKDQCYFPISTNIIENKVGTAPGIWISKNNFNLISMPGVPHEMKFIMNNGGLDKIKLLDPNPATILHKTINTAATGEAIIANLINPIVDEFPPNLKVAFLPQLWQVRIRLSINDSTFEGASNTLRYYENQIVSKLGSIIYGYDDESIQNSLAKLLIKHNKTISTAESCTAGLIGHTIASISGASQYYSGSIISYSNEIKKNILNVNNTTLEKHGAVSEACVIEMLNGLFDLYHTDYGISISGIAGPNGGTTEKPVGTVWIAYGTKENILTSKLKLNKNRIQNMQISTTCALNSLRLLILENEVS